MHPSLLRRSIEVPLSGRKTAAFHGPAT